MRKTVFLFIAILISVSLLFPAFTSAVKANDLSASVPGGYNIEYSGQIDRRTFFVIYSPDDKTCEHFYDEWGVKVGPIDNLKEIKVRNVERFRDGGTTIVETAMGIFYFPTPFSQDKCPTLNDKIIKVYDRPDWERCNK